MRQDRAVAWGGILALTLLVGFVLGRCTAPDGQTAADTSAETPTEEAVAAPPPPPPVVTQAPATTPPTVATEEAPPVPTAEATTPEPTPQGPQTHVVVAGDTLADLAATYYDDPFCFDELAALNGLDPSAGLRVGQELQIAAEGDCTPV